MLKGNNLKARLLTYPDDGVVANDLLTAFFEGYQLAHLEELLLHSNQEVVKSAIWIGSELGTKFRPLLMHADRLLSHPNAYVRFFAIDCILCCASKDDGKIIANAIIHLYDEDAGVRWKAINFIYRASRDQLESALHYYEEAQQDTTDLIRALRWYLTCPCEGFESYITCDDAIMRKFAAASIIANDAINERLSNLISESCDSDTISFINDFVKTAPGL